MNQNLNLIRNFFDIKTQNQTIHDNESSRARSQNVHIDSRNIIENSNQKEFDRLETSIFF